jgi:hypothetical protein
MVSHLPLMSVETIVQGAQAFQRDEWILELLSFVND